MNFVINFFILCKILKNIWKTAYFCYTLLVIPPEVTMKKLCIAIILITVLASTSVFAQFAQLESDFSKLMLLLGREVMPHVQQNDLAGTGIGTASLEGDFFYVALTAGAVVSDGILNR